MMKKFIKRLIRNATPRKLKNVILENEVRAFQAEREHQNISYSQEGEDLFLSRIFGDKKKGFYVDIGAHHPKRFSNTYIFYTRGWRGINIDAMPGSMKLFEKLRPQDLNLEMGISDDHIDRLQYFIFNEPALNTFSPEVAAEKNGTNNYKIIDTIDIPVMEIKEILTKYLPKNQTIDFMSIDVEGYDLKVLKSNNWSKFRPHIIAVEASHLLKLQLHLESDITVFLVKKNYELIGKTYKTLFFRDETIP